MDAGVFLSAASISLLGWNDVAEAYCNLIYRQQ